VSPDYGISDVDLVRRLHELGRAATPERVEAFTVDGQPVGLRHMWLRMKAAHEDGLLGLVCEGQDGAAWYRLTTKGRALADLRGDGRLDPGVPPSGRRARHRTGSARRGQP
jgi:hypothetical protein